MSTTIRDRDLFRRATMSDRCKVCGRPVVCYDWTADDFLVEMVNAEITNPDVCHVNLGNEVVSFWCPFWCPKMVS